MHEKQEHVEIAITYLSHHDGLPPIEKMTDGSSGFDIIAACEDEIVIPPGRASLVPSGFKLSIPQGFEAQVRPRSGLALNQRIGLLNSPGTIDSDFRGEVGVIMFNFGDEDFVARRGDRIAQLVFCPIPGIRLVVKEELDNTVRGPGGFGHTG